MSSAGTSLKPFFTYFGGKYRAAPRYPKPAHDTIVEPFAGAAGYSLRYPERKVILNDLDPYLAGTWNYLINVSRAEIESLPVYDHTWESVDDLTHLPQEARWLIGWWMNKGTTQPSKTPSKWMRTSETLGENYWGPGIRNRIASQVEHIRHWKVSNLHFQDVPNTEATWFIDPPYEVAGKYRVRDVNFPELGEWCRTRQGQTIVCENLGATWLPFEPFLDIKATSGQKRAGVSKEVIWLNNTNQE